MWLNKVFGASRRKRNIDYDEYGNEITNTVPVDVVYDSDEQEEYNYIDDDENALITDTFVDVDDYDVHLPPQVTQVELSSSGEMVDNETLDASGDQQLDVDGFSVDKLWDVPDGRYNP